MPKFLKNNTIVLLDGGVESYLMALYGMAMPTLRNLRKPETKQAPIVGLYGAAAELLVKACLVQAKGVEAMYKDGNIASGVYRSCKPFIGYNIAFKVRKEDFIGAKALPFFRSYKTFAFHE